MSRLPVLYACIHGRAGIPKTPSLEGELKGVSCPPVLGLPLGVMLAPPVPTVKRMGSLQTVRFYALGLPPVQRLGSLGRAEWCLVHHSAVRSFAILPFAPFALFALFFNSANRPFDCKYFSLIVNVPLCNRNLARIA